MIVTAILLLPGLAPSTGNWQYNLYACHSLPRVLDLYPYCASNQGSRLYRALLGCHHPCPCLTIVILNWHPAQGSCNSFRVAATGRNCLWWCAFCKGRKAKLPQHDVKYELIKLADWRNYVAENTVLQFLYSRKNRIKIMCWTQLIQEINKLYSERESCWDLQSVPWISILLRLKHNSRIVKDIQFVANYP